MDIQFNSFPKRNPEGGTIDHITITKSDEALIARAVAAGFDSTPIRGELAENVAAIIGLIESQAGPGASLVAHLTDLRMLQIKYGAEAVRELVAQGRLAW